MPGEGDLSDQYEQDVCGGKLIALLFIKLRVADVRLYFLAIP